MPRKLLASKTEVLNTRPSYVFRAARLNIQKNCVIFLMKNRYLISERNTLLISSAFGSTDSYEQLFSFMKHVSSRTRMVLTDENFKGCIVNSNNRN
jgi:hypothetical protein